MFKILNFVINIALKNIQDGAESITGKPVEDVISNDQVWKLSPSTVNDSFPWLYRLYNIAHNSLKNYKNAYYMQHMI